MAYYIPKSHGRQYTRNKSGRSVPATDRENLQSMQRRYDSLIEQRAAYLGADNEAGVNYCDVQIGYVQQSMDNLSERMGGVA